MFANTWQRLVQGWKAGTWFAYVPHGVVIAALAFAGVAIAVIRGWSPDFPGRYCDNGQSHIACLRDWATIIGGWAALLVGALSIRYLLEQIDVARQGVEHQQKSAEQSAFESARADDRDRARIAEANRGTLNWLEAQITGIRSRKSVLVTADVKKIVDELQGNARPNRLRFVDHFQLSEMRRSPVFSDAYLAAKSTDTKLNNHATILWEERNKSTYDAQIAKTKVSFLKRVDEHKAALVRYEEVSEACKIALERGIQLRQLELDELEELQQLIAQTPRIGALTEVKRPTTAQDPD